MATRKAAESAPVPARPKGSVEAFRGGPLAAFLTAGPVLEVDATGHAVAEEGQATVFAHYRLQNIADYRAALQGWFRLVRIGGHLVIVVPHAFLHDRQLELPSRRHPGQSRLYTPASLLEEVEEALAPNSYRLRFLGDADEGYDYGLPSDRVPVGQGDILLALERIAPPAWTLDLPVEVKAAAPDYSFRPARTRIEVALRPHHRRILILKLDHLGDFIMGICALEKARALFADAEITLVVGSWNVQTARELGLADQVVAFDAFPRNSSEEQVDVPGKTALFQRLIVGDYDLAIDLRTDPDTRFLLKHVDAPIRAGVGTAAQFPFLDIFLPLDFNRNHPETAYEHRFGHHDFRAQDRVVRADYRTSSEAVLVRRDSAIIWGPYRHIRPGRYFFEPFLELAPRGDGLLMLDVGINAERVAYATVPPARGVRLPFVVKRSDAEFEFRIWTVDDLPAIDFDFYGGRLVREGAGSVLHQSEYTTLLIDLIAMRLARTGLLADAELP